MIHFPSSNKAGPNKQLTKDVNVIDEKDSVAVAVREPAMGIWRAGITTWKRFRLGDGFGQ